MSTKTPIFFLCQVVAARKGVPTACLVEYVVNGGTLRLTLLDDWSTLTLMLSGVQCPSMGRGGPDAAPEPYAREAKHLAECTVLHRRMTLLVEGEDKFAHVFGR